MRRRWWWVVWWGARQQGCGRMGVPKEKYEPHSDAGNIPRTSMSYQSFTGQSKVIAVALRE